MVGNGGTNGGSGGGDNGNKPRILLLPEGLELGLTPESVKNVYAPEFVKIYKRNFPQRTADTMSVLRTVSRVIECAGDVALHGNGLATFSDDEANCAREMLAVIDEMANRAVLKKPDEHMQVSETFDAAGLRRFKISEMKDHLIRQTIVAMVGVSLGAGERDISSLIPVNLSKQGILTKDASDRFQFLEDYMFLQNIADLDHLLAKIPVDNNGTITINAKNVTEFAPLHGIEQLTFLLSENFPSVYASIQSKSREGALVLDANDLLRLKTFIDEAKFIAPTPNGPRYVGQAAGDECLRQRCEPYPEIKLFYDFRRLAVVEKRPGEVNWRVHPRAPEHRETIRESIMAIVPDFEDRIVDRGGHFDVPAKAMDRIHEVHKKIDGFVEKGQFDEAIAYIATARQEGAGRAAAHQAKLATKAAAVSEPQGGGVATSVIAKREQEEFMQPLEGAEKILAVTDRLSGPKDGKEFIHRPSDGYYLLRFKTREEADASATVLQKLSGDRHGVYTDVRGGDGKPTQIYVRIDASAYNEILEVAELLKGYVSQARAQFTTDKTAAEQNRKEALDWLESYKLGTDDTQGLPDMGGQKRS